MPLSDLAIQMENVDKKYFLFRKQLKTFVEALKFFRNSTFPSVEPLRTVEELDTLVNRSGQSNATYSSAIKLWLQVYDDLRSLIHEQVLAAQACAPDVTDEVLKIRVTEALEYVNEMTQPDYDVVANKLDEEMTKRLQDTQHDELFHLNFSDRRMFGAIVSLLPLALEAVRHSINLTGALAKTADVTLKARQSAQTASEARSVSSRASTQSKKPWRPSGPVTPQARKHSSIL